MIKSFLLKPPAQRVYKTHNKAMMVANLVDILCTTDLSLISTKFKYIDVIKVHTI